MRFISTVRFDREYQSLPIEHRQLFRAVIPAFNSACDAYIKDPSQPWPARLRVKLMVNQSRIWEMTWSFSGPDGRATFEFADLGGETGVRWRRIGGHGIYTTP